MRRKCKSNYFKGLDLPEEVTEGIESRSSMLSATLKTISKEDLIQEGLLLVYKILDKKPEVPLPYLMKAINNKYCAIQKQEIKYKTSTKSLFTDNVEKELDTIVLRQHQKRPKIRRPVSPTDAMLGGEARGYVEPIVILQEHGMSFKDIAQYLGKDLKTVRRLLKRHGKETYDKEE